MSHVFEEREESDNRVSRMSEARSMMLAGVSAPKVAERMGLTREQLTELLREAL